MNANTYQVLYEKNISDTQKIVVHVISFGEKNPVLAVQHMWRKNTADDWKYGKISAINESLLEELLEQNVFENALKIIKDNLKN